MFKSLKRYGCCTSAYLREGFWKEKGRQTCKNAYAPLPASYARIVTGLLKNRATSGFAPDGIVPLVQLATRKTNIALQLTTVTIVIVTLSRLNAL